MTAIDGVDEDISFRFRKSGPGIDNVGAADTESHSENLSVERKLSYTSLPEQALVNSGPVFDTLHEDVGVNGDPDVHRNEVEEDWEDPEDHRSEEELHEEYHEHQDREVEGRRGQEDQEEVEIEGLSGGRRRLSETLVPSCGCDNCASTVEDYIFRFSQGSVGLDSSDCVNVCLFGNIAVDATYGALANDEFLAPNQFDLVQTFGNDALQYLSVLRSRQFSSNNFGILRGQLLVPSTPSPLPNVFTGEDATIQTCLVKCADSVYCNSFEIVPGKYCRLKINALSSSSVLVPATINTVGISTVYFTTSSTGGVSSRTFVEVTLPFIDYLGFGPLNSSFAEQPFSPFLASSLSVFTTPADTTLLRPPLKPAPFPVYPFPFPFSYNLFNAVAVRIFDGCDTVRRDDTINFFQPTWAGFFAYLWEEFGVVVPREVEKRLVVATLYQDTQYALITGCDIDLFFNSSNGPRRYSAADITPGFDDDIYNAGNGGNAILDPSFLRDAQVDSGVKNDEGITSSNTEAADSHPFLIPSCHYLDTPLFQASLRSCSPSSIFGPALFDFCEIMNQTYPANTNSYNIRYASGQPHGKVFTQHVEACAERLSRFYLEPLSEPLSRLQIRETVRRLRISGRLC